MEKAKARSAWRRKRREITAEEFAENSQIVIAKLREIPELRRARVVMAFAPLADEVDIKPLLEELKSQGKRIVFPALVGVEGRMDAHEVEDFSRGLRRGRFGVLLPVDGIPVDPRSIDFIFVPAVAYNGTGHRLGRGGGYYDRFLAGRAIKAFRCGVALECQVLESIPVREHDCAVELLVTESRVRRFPRGANSSSQGRENTINS